MEKETVMKRKCQIDLLFLKEYFGNGIFQCVLGQCPDCHLWLSVHRDEQHGRNAAYIESCSQFLFRFGIDLINIDLAGIFRRQLLEEGSNE